MINWQAVLKAIKLHQRLQNECVHEWAPTEPPSICPSRTLNILAWTDKLIFFIIFEVKYQPHIQLKQLCGKQDGKYITAKQTKFCNVWYAFGKLWRWSTHSDGTAWKPHYHCASSMCSWWCLLLRAKNLHLDKVRIEDIQRTGIHKTWASAN